MELWLIFIVFVFIFWKVRYYTTKRPSNKLDKLNELVKELERKRELLKNDKSLSNKPITTLIEQPIIPHIDTRLDQFNTEYMFISAKAKAEYMQSKQWVNLKSQRLIIANNKCECCGSINNLQLHHETYVRLTVEDINDVKILCGVCHNKLHAILGYDRATLYPISILKD